MINSGFLFKTKTDNSHYIYGLLYVVRRQCSKNFEITGLIVMPL